MQIKLTLDVLSGRPNSSLVLSSRKGRLADNSGNPISEPRTADREPKRNFAALCK